MDKHAEKIKKRYNRNARLYDFMQAGMEKGKMGKWRGLVFKDIKGKVLEVGVGTGMNIKYYPVNAEVTAIDFSEKMLEKAREKAAKLGRNVDFRLMDVQNLEFPNETFDTVITSFVFCSVPDPIKGLEEIRRVCKKDGQIIMLEHVRSKKPLLGAVMDFMNPIIVRIAGANINRDTVKNLKTAGIVVNTDENLMLDVVKHLKCTKW